MARFFPNVCLQNLEKNFGAAFFFSYNYDRITFLLANQFFYKWMPVMCWIISTEFYDILEN